MAVRVGRIHTKMRCQFCKEEDCLAAGHNGTRTVFYCERCERTWEHGPEVCSIRQIETHYGKCTNVFCGAWLDEEIKLVAQKAFVNNEREHDEWGWFKGRHFYTAWRLGTHGVVVMARTLPALVERIAELCKPRLSL